MNEKFKWKYNLKGKVIELLPKTSNMVFSTKCRESITRTVVFEKMEETVERMVVGEEEQGDTKLG